MLLKPTGVQAALVEEAIEARLSSQGLDEAERAELQAVLMDFKKYRLAQ